jgi:hypothetical protein
MDSTDYVVVFCLMAEVMLGFETLYSYVFKLIDGEKCQTIRVNLMAQLRQKVLDKFIAIFKKSNHHTSCIRITTRHRHKFTARQIQVYYEAQIQNYYETQTQVYCEADTGLLRGTDTSLLFAIVHNRDRLCILQATGHG